MRTEKHLPYMYLVAPALFRYFCEVVISCPLAINTDFIFESGDWRVFVLLKEDIKMCTIVCVNSFVYGTDTNSILHEVPKLRTVGAPKQF